MQNSSTLSSNRDKPISPNLIQLEKPLLPPSTFFPFKQGLTSIQISKDWGKGNWNYKSLKFLWQTQVLWCFHTCQHKFIRTQNFDFNVFAANTNPEALYLNSISSFRHAKGIFTTHFSPSHWRIEPVHVWHGPKVLWLAQFQTHLQQRRPLSSESSDSYYALLAIWSLQPSSSKGESPPTNSLHSSKFVVVQNQMVFQEIVLSENSLTKPISQIAIQVSYNISHSIVTFSCFGFITNLTSSTTGHALIKTTMPGNSHSWKKALISRHVQERDTILIQTTTLQRLCRIVKESFKKIGMVDILMKKRKFETNWYLNIEITHSNYSDMFETRKKLE